MVFTKTAAFYTEQCTSPSLSHNFKVSRDHSNWSLKNYCFICDAIFFTCTHAHIAPSNKTKSLLKIADLEIWLVCMETTGRAGFADPHWLSAWTDTWVSNSSTNAAYIYTEEACGDKTCCCSVIDGKLQLKHAPAANKKWHKKHWKCNEMLGYHISKKHRNNVGKIATLQYTDPPYRYVGWSCIVNVFVLSSLPCFPAFCWSAIPTSY